MMGVDTYRLMALANALMALLIAALQAGAIRHSGRKWPRAVMLALGLYWAMVYGYIFLGFPGWEQFYCAPLGDGNCDMLYEQLFIRPGITLTLAIMTGRILRHRGQP